MTGTRGFVVPKAFGTLVFGICALLVIVAALTWHHTIRLENRLEHHVREALQGAGFDLPGIHIHGREVILDGEVDAQVDHGRMIEIVQSVEGVRSVRDDRIVIHFAVARRFELHSYAGITTVQGELPAQQDIKLVIDAIRDHFGVDPLGADLKVMPMVRRPPFLDELMMILEVLSAVSPLRLEYGDSTLTISGDVSDDETRERVRHRLSDILDEQTGLIMHLRLPNMTREPELRIQYRNGALSVSGSVPETEFIEQLVAALAMAFAVDEVDNDLRVDPDVLYSDWLEGILRIVFPLAMTNWLEVEISEGKATLRGSVRHEEELEILREQIRDNFDYPIRVVNLIQ